MPMNGHGNKLSMMKGVVYIQAGICSETKAEQAELIRLIRSNQDVRIVRRVQMIQKQVIRRYPI